MEAHVTDQAELRQLARVAMRDYPSDQDGHPYPSDQDGHPSWIGALAALPMPATTTFHAFDRLVHDGLVAWTAGGWRITEVGRRALKRVGVLPP